MPDKSYEFFEHTADVGLRVYGKTVEELLVNAARGLVEVLVEDSPVVATEPRMIALNASSVSQLLHTWLKELLFWFATERFLPASFHLDAVTETEVRGRIVGERFDPRRHTQGTEVKGITSHQFHVEQTSDGWEASVILDV
jgi:SHS2 domain-containing protein